MSKKLWWIPVLGGVLEAIYALTNLFMPQPDGFLTLRTFAPRGTVLQLGMVALTAGLCTIAVGTRVFRSWPLALNGVAFCALGLLSLLSNYRISFRLIAVVLAVLAATLATHLGQRRLWTWNPSAAVPVGFAVAFLAMALGWTAPGRPESIYIWMGSYFGFSAACLLTLFRHPASLS
jgi:hypothetical protein